MFCRTVFDPLPVPPFPIGLPVYVAPIPDEPITMVPPATSEGFRLGHGEEGGPADDVMLGPAGHLGLERTQPRDLRRLPGFCPVEVGEPEAGIRFRKLKTGPRRQLEGTGPPLRP